jgi:hypothetical protein
METPDELLFWIVPRNRLASEALRNVNNKHYVAHLSELEEAFAVNCNGAASQTPGCLVTIGREGDIEICGSLVSAIQCQILLNPSTKEILLRDKSTFQSTMIQLRSDLSPLYFNSRGPRQIVLRQDDSVLIGMGGDNSRLFQFEIVWPPSDEMKCDRVEVLKKDFVNLPKKARLAVTAEENPGPGSRYNTRIQKMPNNEKWLHRPIKMLGSGTYGEVHQTVNMHTGNYYAVKSLTRPRNAANDMTWRRDVLREVTTLQKLSHVSSLWSQ